MPCLLYNNPVSYKTDFLPAQIKELADENSNLVAVKESSADVRRVTALKAICGARLAIFVGVDEAIVEGIRAGTVGWIAGLSTLSRASRWRFSTTPCAAKQKRPRSSTDGSCRCCGWTRS